MNLRSLRQFSREVILLVSPFFSIVLGLSRVVNNKPFLLSFGESYVFLVYCGSLPQLSGGAAVGLASSHILSLPGAFGSEGSQWEFITIVLFFFSFSRSLGSFAVPPFINTLVLI